MSGVYLETSFFSECCTIRTGEIASLYHGDLRKHAAETHRIVEPLIEKPGLREGTPARKDDRRSGTEG